jgi:hypothetical protein
MSEQNEQRQIANEIIASIISQLEEVCIRDGCGLTELGISELALRLRLASELLSDADSVTQ